MNKIILVAAFVAAFLLLAPYVGVNVFGPAAMHEDEQTPPAPSSAGERSPEPAARKPKQARVEDLLAPKSAEPASAQRLSDIENLLNKNGQDK